MSKKILWLTWEDHRRSRSLARLLGAELHEFAATLGRPRLVRYAINVRDTVRILRTRRPATVVCQHPSFVLALLAVLLRPAFGYRLGLDAHNGGLAVDAGLRWPLRRLAAWLQRRADFVIVHNDAVARRVAGHGGALLALPDPLPEIGDGPPFPLPAGFNLLFLCAFKPDEPYREVMAVARRLGPDVAIHVTGTPHGHDPAGPWPDNVVFHGRLPWDRYDRLLRTVDGVIDLTTRDDCLLCGAYEAVAAGKPMILSRTAALMAYFSRGAVFTDNRAIESPHSIEWAIGELRRREGELAGEVALLADELARDWQARRQRLDALL